MTRLDTLDRALATWLEDEAAAPVPDGLLETALAKTAQRKPRPAWIAQARGGISLATPGRETTRTLGIAAALVALLLLVAGLALIGGGSRRPSLLADATPAPVATTKPAVTTAPTAAAPATPIASDYRATWLSVIGELPLLGTGAGPVSMEIASDGATMSVANVAPGATFPSAIDLGGDGRLTLTLTAASGRCDAGAVGTYRATLNADGSLLALVADADACATRAEALTRTWGRSLAGATTRGTGFVDTMNPTFSVSLPDKTMSARRLPDMIEIGSDDGFSLMAFRNPQGFAHPCVDETRLPYTQGAAAFADYFAQNRAVDVVSREELTIDGHPAIHLVLRPKPGPDGCGNGRQDITLWTPQACNCHFTGGHDSLYLVDVDDATTLMFEVSPVDATNPLERQIIDSLRIPATIPGG